MTKEIPTIGINWTELRIFLEVARSKSFNKAAQELGVTDPTVARAVRRLEAELNTPLLAGAGARGVVLTPAGSRLERALEEGHLRGLRSACGRVECDRRKPRSAPAKAAPRRRSALKILLARIRDALHRRRSILPPATIFSIRRRSHRHNHRNPDLYSAHKPKGATNPNLSRLIFGRPP
jgi:hypothetical protein